MNLFHSIIFGAVEGAAEFLPISSTGHLMLTAHLLGLSQTEFLKSFEIAIQLGAILSVVALYWRSFLVNFEVLKRVLAAFLPTAVIGFILYKSIKKFLMGDIKIVLWSLLVGGILLIIFDKVEEGKERSIRSVAEIPYLKAFWIGVCQALAVIPGVSRSAATIVGGSLLGVERKTIVEFSFLLAVPTMAAATALDLLKSAGEFSKDQCVFLSAGFLASFIVATLVIKWLLAFIKHHGFTRFGIYRILVALLFFFLIR